LRLLEYQGKQLFERVGLPVPPGRLATTPEDAERIAHELGPPVVVKAQVAAGGRGKAGGVKLAHTPEEARQRAEEILQLKIQGEPVRKLLLDRGRRGHRGGRPSSARAHLQGAHRAAGGPAPLPDSLAAPGW